MREITIRRVSNGFIVFNGSGDSRTPVAFSDTRVAETRDTVLDIVMLWVDTLLENEEPKEEN